MLHDLPLHIALALLMPPLIPGVIAKTKAFFAGRNGPPVLQHYYDIWKLFRKGSVISDTTTWIFVAGPVVSAATAIVAAMLVPLGSHPALISFPGDIVLFAYLFALGRFLLTSASLDTGSAFEGMGAAREVSFACLAEPALFLGFLVIHRVSGSLALSEMLTTPWIGRDFASSASLMLVLVSWFIVMLAENCRIPVDDPNTHLELTMIHEVMVLDHSGPLLGIVLYGAAMKLFVIGAIVARLMLPFESGNGAIDWCLFVAGILLVAIIIGVIESIMARLRLVRVPLLLVTSCLLAGMGLVLIIR